MKGQEGEMTRGKRTVRRENRGKRTGRGEDKGVKGQGGEMTRGQRDSGQGEDMEKRK